MIDLHLHLLPGIDDGAGDLDEAEAMCRQALDDGCHTLIVTPHQRTDLWENRNHDGQVTDLVDRVRAVAPEGLEIHPGAEVHVDSELLTELEDVSAYGVLPLAGSRWLLLELDRAGVELGPDPEELTHELVVAGWRPIYAHPEMIRGLGEDLDLARRLVDLGATFQLTAMSLLGDFGPRARDVCHAFLDQGLAHFIASDAHGLDWRPPGLSAARRYVSRVWDPELAWRLTEGHAAAVLADQPLLAEAVS